MSLTLNEYLLGARKLLSLYGYRCHKNDEDAISSVASAMIMADETWDGCRSSKDTWRFNQAKFAIMKLKTKHRKQRKVMSLDYIVNSRNDKRVVLSDTLENKSSGNNMENSFKEVMCYAKKRLSPRQYECLRLYYQEDLTLDEIGKTLNITKQAVSLSVKKGIEIIRDECQSKVDYITY
jgi:RNA polymerase sigma factor (sigma-70 family)